MLSSIEPELQEKYYSKIVPTYTEKQLPTSTDFHKPNKAKIIALACLDLLNLFQFKILRIIKKYLQTNKISEYRIKNILALLNQIITIVINT